MRLDLKMIEDVSLRVYGQHFGADVIDGVFAEDFTDSDGKENLKVKVLLRSGNMERVKDKSFGDVALDLQDELTAAGEERFAYIGVSEAGDAFEDEEREEPSTEGDTVGRSQSQAPPRTSGTPDRTAAGGATEAR